MSLEVIAEAASTNLLLAERGSALTHGDAIMALSQTAGRGQRGNSWEAEPGRNITMSLWLTPQGLEARRQYLLSEVVAVGVARVLRRRLPGQNVSIKWPNDIYVDNRKLCGILIQCSLSGHHVSHAIVGIGINVNQTEFRSDAPNPVSIKQLLGTDTPLVPLAEELIAEILTLTATTFPYPAPASDAAQPVPALYAEYESMLLRREGLHRYYDKIRGEEILATFHTVLPHGPIILLTHPTLEPREYSIQQLTYIFP